MLTALAIGRFMVSEFVVVEILNIFPAVPSRNTFVMTLLLNVICVEVPINTFCPPAIDKPDPTVRDPSVVVPRPPLVTARGVCKC